MRKTYLHQPAATRQPEQNVTTPGHELTSTASGEHVQPISYWVHLREACRLKGLAYKTACNKPYLQPNDGVPEARIGGRKCWSWHTVIDWLPLTDDDLNGEGGAR